MGAAENVRGIVGRHGEMEQEKSGREVGGSLQKQRLFPMIRRMLQQQQQQNEEEQDEQVGTAAERREGGMRMRRWSSSSSR
jgi:hypothetical protein